MVGLIPNEWEENSLTKYDENWVKEHLLNAKLLQGMGAMYMGVLAWVKNLKKLFGPLVEKIEAIYTNSKT